MAILLHIETATERCSVALAEGARLLSLQESEAAFSHASQLTLLIAAALKAAGLSMDQLAAVALSSGPGSYTGLRIGSATAKGICYAQDLPLIAVDTLQSLALASRQKQLDAPVLYAPMIDARRMEVYTAGYDFNNELTMKMQALILDELAFKHYFDQGYSIVFSGNGSAKCRDLFPSEKAIFSPVLCSAAHLIPLAEKAFQAQNFVDQAYFSPTYFKAPNITKPKKIL